MTQELDLDSAVTAYWSLTRVGVTRESIIAAWTEAAGRVWNDEHHVDADEEGARADFLFNSGHVRMSICECVLLAAPVSNGTTHFLTAVLSESFGLNLGWALHTRTLDRTEGEGWPNPRFGERAVAGWRDFERLRLMAEEAR